MSDFDPIVTVRRADLRAALMPRSGRPNGQTVAAMGRLADAAEGMQCWEPAVVPAEDARRLVELARKRLTLTCPDEMVVERLADCLGMNNEEAADAR